MPNRNLEGPNEWEHSEEGRGTIERDPVATVKIIIAVGFIPVIVFGIIVLINWCF